MSGLVEMRLNSLRMQSNMAQIVSYSECKCGAITLFFDNGATNSVKKRNLKKFGISLKGIEKLNNTWCCNHCANNYGIDICECGSGISPQKCSCGCGRAMEELGVEFDGFSKILKNYGRL